MQPEILAKHSKAGARRVGTEAKQTSVGEKQIAAKKKSTTKKAETVAWENPLIPNARLRQIYLTMTQARTLEQALPAAKRAHTITSTAKSAGKKSVAAKAAGSFGLEAALVGAAFDLGSGDLVSDALTGGAVELLRGASLGEVLRPKPAGTTRRQARKAAATTTAAQLIAPSTIAERVWAAIGAASALKAAHTQAKNEAEQQAAAKANDEQTESNEQAEGVQQAGVVALFTLPGEVPAPLWKTALAFVAAETLPIVFVVLPVARERGGKAHGENARAAKFGRVSEISLASGIPAIAVDADDAIAIYRVAQESIGRARAGGGAALIECVPFVPEGAPKATARNKATRGGAKRTAVKEAAPADAIATLQRYLLQRGIATKAWLEREAKSFAKRLAKLKAK